MTVSLVYSDFATPERTEKNILKWEIGHFADMKILKYFLDVVPNIITVLNENRQIVFANKTFSDALGLSDPSLLHGKRPGEALDCIYSDLNDAGCGTSRFCRNCHGVRSILNCLDGNANTMECTILRKDSKPPLELRVTSYPFNVNNSKYVVFSAVDICHEKRRRVLEKTFFHDISNSLTGVQGYAEILENQDLGHANEWVKKMSFCVREAVEELFSQKTLLAAEDSELQINKGVINSIDILNSATSVFSFELNNSNNNGKIIIDKKSENFEFITDRTLLSRVLINMVKNGIEASPEKPVIIGCYRRGDDNVLFRVSNSGYMSEDIQAQIFKRSFSTKGKGRGIGTYSMKLLTEKYLNGKVSFTSNKDEGTTFFVDLPKG